MTTQAAPSLALELTVRPVLCLALEQNGIPLVERLELGNPGPEALAGLVLELQLGPDLGPPQRFDLSGGVEPGGRSAFGPFDFRAPAGHLRGVREAEPGELVWRLLQGEAVLAEGREAVRLLPPHHWPHRAAPAELLAAFVQPHDPAVARLLPRVARRLGEVTGDRALTGYQRRDPARVRATAEALYDAVVADRLGYVGAPPSFERSGQKIRLPEALYADEMGCCLDLTVLMAAALEQMGLNALLVLIEGHAFPGVWLEDEAFHEGVATSAARVRNEVARGRLLVWDSSIVTASPPVPFDEALLAGERQLDDATFEVALDLAVVRRQPVRPLALRAEALAGGTEPLPPGPEAAPELAVDPLAPASAVEPAPPPPPATTRGHRVDPYPELARRFARWQESLLDLSMRNRLLNFNPKGKTSVPLLVPDPAQLEDLLAVGAREFLLLPWPQDTLGERDPALMERRGLATQQEEQLRRAVADHRLVSPLSREPLTAALKAIDRAARGALEEGGAHTLYLSLGLLAYHEHEGAGAARLAPLLLVPVQLTADRLRGHYTLRWTGEDALPNVTLVEKLRQDFDIDIQGVLQPGADEHGVDLHSLFNCVRDGIRRFERWEVREEVHLGLFSFTKFLMWKDLHDNREALLENEVVRHIASVEARGFAQAAPPVTAAHLEATGRSLAEVPCVVDADATQLTAIATALAGQSFVLQGPPGTGKSQTITNMIAALLAAGKTVLFVSEKMAALQVVERRLRAAGLGDFCLELHSHESSKKAVLESLKATYARATRVGAVPWAERVAELDALRDTLNALAQALHGPRPLGLSFHEAFGAWLALADAPALRLAPADPAALDQDRLRAMRTALEAFVARAATVEPVARHPWRGTRPGAWQVQTRSRLEALLAGAPPVLAAVPPARQALWAALGLPPREDEAACQAALALAAALSEGPAPVSAFEEVWDATVARVAAWEQDRQALAAKRERLGAAWLPALEAPELMPLGQRIRAALRQPGWLRFFSLWGERRRLKALSRGPLPEDAALAAALDEATAIRERAFEVEAEATQLRLALGSVPPGAGEDPAAVAPAELSLDALAAVLGRGTRTRRALLALAATGVAIEASLHRWRALGGPERAALAAAAEAVYAAEERLSQLDGTLRDALGVAPGELWPALGLDGHRAGLAEVAVRLEQGMPRLQAWCFFRAAADAAVAQGLEAVVAWHAAGGLAAAELPRAWERAMLEAWLVAVRDADPALASFYGPEHAFTVERFRALDEAFRELSKQHVVARLEAQLPHPGGHAVESGEPGVLLREAAKKTRQMAVRTLLRRIPNLVSRLAPCFLMSPMSIAQYLPPGFKRFDVVIFDEASQIGTHDAIGAIARGRQVVIVGDSRQLPPTTFFQRRLDEDEAPDDNDMVELESILDEAVVKQLPEQMLGWHYRSRHDALIAFSNAHYYDRRLTIFPPARRFVSELGLKWHAVPGGVYQGGAGEAAATNPVEAQALVAHLVEAMRQVEPGARTFGVVTFSMAQQTLILDLLEAARERHPELEGHFRGLEPVFVKNLENVQGDERDVIYFSICYAPDAEGRLRMHFGPLSLKGGERRLNVAITRARSLLRVFSSLRAEQIDLRRTTSVGAAQLRAFLRFAASQDEADAEAARQRRPATSVGRALAERLAEAGFEVHAEVGAGEYRVELAVVHPTRPGVYAIGIETDGAHYASAETARDRERIRASVLGALGWRLTRVFTLDWWNDPEAEVRRVLAAVEEAIAAPWEAPSEPAPPPEPAPPAAEPLPGPSSPVRPYVAAALPPAVGGPEAFAAPEAAPAIRQALQAVVEAEGPIHVDLACRRVMAAWGVARLTEAVRRRVAKAAEGLALVGALDVHGAFYWPAGSVPEAWAIARSGERDAEHWPPEEVRVALAWVLEANLSCGREEAAREVGRLLGVARPGKAAVQAVGEAVEALLAAGVCRLEGEALVWGAR